MKTLGILLSLVAATVVSAAQIKISELPLATSPSTNTFLLISDMDAATKSQKYLLTNLQTTLNQNSNLTVSNITSGGYLSLSGETNRVTMSADGELQVDGAAVGGGDTIWTNDANASTIYIHPSQLRNRIYSHNASGAGENTRTLQVVAPETDDWNDYGSVELVARKDEAKVVVESSATSGDSTSWLLTAEPTVLTFNLSTDAATITDWALVRSGANTNTGAYRWGTPVAYNSSNVFAIFNGPVDNPANIKAAFSSDGRLRLEGTTNHIVFGSTNTTPNDPGSIKKWISVQVKGEAAVYRLPLYE